MTNPDESRRVLREALLLFAPDLATDNESVGSEEWCATHPELLELVFATLSDDDWMVLADVLPPGSVSEDELVRFERLRRISVASAAVRAEAGAWSLPGGTVFGVARALAQADARTVARALHMSEPELAAIESGRQAWVTLPRSHLEHFAALVQLSVHALLNLLRPAGAREIAARLSWPTTVGGASFRREVHENSVGGIADGAVHDALVESYASFFRQFSDLNVDQRPASRKETVPTPRRSR
jgi:hypothetical protein